ncbi:MAG: GTPase ObgE [Patescibacteria group bacterium]
MKQRLVDIANITISGGKGGDGAVTFIRKKYIPKGGPDGGNGGKGGSVYFIATNSMATLLDFRSKREYFAQDGEMGGANNITGADAPDLEIRVPVGTQIYETRSSGEEVLIGDLIKAGDMLMASRGGKGGKGNLSFKSSTNQTPRQFTYGNPGEVKQIRLEIKLIADVGLVGFPNAGKSTLVNVLTNANAKVDSYAFTTLIPNLGVCLLPNNTKIIVADIPGLIEGASEGKGLGDDFLRHVERTRMLVHIIDPYENGDHLLSAQNDSITKELLVAKALDSYKKIRIELEKYSTKLLEKEETVVINKIDLTEVSESINELRSAFKEHYNIDVHFISAITRSGVGELINLIMHRLDSIPRTVFKVSEITRVYNIGDLPNKRIVFMEERSDDYYDEYKKSMDTFKHIAG